jgi:hypothetical protein
MENNHMKRKCLAIGISTVSVLLLVLGSLSNVVGYQTVKSLENHAPNAPDIIGPEELKVGHSYLFTFVTTDPDGDNVSYSIDWGDGNGILWAGPFKSGQVINFEHTWTKEDTIYIKAKTKDLPYEDESNWTIHPIRWSYSLSPQINYQNTINNKVSQREMLFQTIVDIANNKDIQRIILKSQMSRGIFPTSEFPVITKNQIRQMFFLGLILSKFISKSRIQSLIGKYQFNNQEIQKDIATVIEIDKTLTTEITQLKDSDCNCENEINQEKISTTDFSDTPIICGISIILILICVALEAPFSTIENYLQNMYLEHLERLFVLITFPIVFPIVVTGLISLYICFHFNCINFGYP